MGFFVFISKCKNIVQAECVCWNIKGTERGGKLLTNDLGIFCWWCLAHTVFVLLLDRHLLALELVVDSDIQVSWVAVVGGAGQLARDGLAGLDGHGLLGVEDGLLPVGVLGVGTSREVDGLVASVERDVEPRDEGVDVVVTVGSDREGHAEVEVLLRDSQDINVLEGAGRGHNRLGIDSVHKGLLEGNLFDRRVVEAVDVVPVWKERKLTQTMMLVNKVTKRNVGSGQANKYRSRQLTSNLLILVVTVLNGSNVHGGLVGEDETAGGKVLVTGNEDSVQHGLVQQEVTHPLGDDNVNVLNGQDNLLHLSLDQGHNVVELVVLDNLTGVVDNVGHVNTNDHLGSGLGSEHGEDSGAASDIEDDLVLEQVAVLVDRSTVGQSTDFILQHFLLRVRERERA